jgi:T5SS/PEP-CTERM-associated repeat protein
MLRKLLGCACAALGLAAAAVGQAAITQEGGVAITPSLVQVGTLVTSTQAPVLSNGKLWVTSPSALVSSTLNIGTPPGTAVASGAVYIQGGTATHQEGVYVGRGGNGLLEITEGGVLTGNIVRIGGDLNTSQISPQGLIAIHGPGSKLRYSSLTIGASSDGQLLITGGGEASSQGTTQGQFATIAYNSGATGRAVIDGVGSLWHHAGTISVGGAGPGNMQITNGGVVISNGGQVGGEGQSAFGSVMIDGPGSRWTVNTLSAGGVGSTGFGEIFVTNGGTLEQGSNDLATSLGLNGYGRIVVNGPSSRWIRPGGIKLGGNSGTGEVFLENGTQFTSAGADMATGNGRFVVSGPMTRWTSTGSIILGKAQNQASLELLDGATLNLPTGSPVDIGANGRLVLDNGRLLSPSTRFAFTNAGVVQGGGVIQGSGVTNNGRVLVGPGERLQIAGRFTHTAAGVIEVNDGELELGSFDASPGSRVIAGGATLRATGPQFPWNSRGAVTFADGRNRVFGQYVNTGATIVASGAEAEFYDQVLNNGTMSVAAGGKLTTFAALSVRGVGGAGDVYLEGPVQPGGNLGPMEFGGNVYFGGAGQLQIDIIANTPAQYWDQIQVAGDVSLSGALQLAAHSGLPTPSATLSIVQADELSGVFSSIPAIGSTIGAGVRFHGVTYDYAQDRVLVSLTQGLEGDLNLDGQLSGLDFLAWQRASGSTCEAGMGADANCDGVVDGADLAVWRTAVAAASASQGAAQAAVPEPASWGLAIVGVVAGLGAGCRRRVGRDLQ